MRPGTHFHQRFIYNLASKDKAGMKAAAERVAAWDFGTSSVANLPMSSRWECGQFEQLSPWC